MLQSLNKSLLKNLSILLLWLFHLSAIIGVALGYFDWFIEKTPFNLILLGLLLTLNYPIDNLKKWVVVLLFFGLAMFAEWVGVKYGFLFGEYTYGQNLGVKLDGVPILIGLNWVVLAFSTAAIAAHFINNSALKILLGALLMVLLDVFIEVAAQPLDYWHWAVGHAPFRNFIAWFALALVMHLIYHLSRLKGDFRFSIHLYVVQLLFFVYFFWIYS